jgi:hypothetical protein
MTCVPPKVRQVEIGGTAMANCIPFGEDVASAEPPSPFGPARLVKSRDGKFDGKVIGTPVDSRKRRHGSSDTTSSGPLVSTSWTGSSRN